MGRKKSSAVKFEFKEGADLPNVAILPQDNKRTPKAPPKRAATIPLGRPIDRLQPADRERIKADVAAFLAYVRRRKGLAVAALLILATIYLPIAAGPGSSVLPAQPTPTPTAIRPPG